jgi:hypothetical protein
VPKIADIPVPGYQSFWIDQRKTLKSEYQLLKSKFPDADTQLKQLFKVLCGIKHVARYTPASVGDGEQGSSTVSAAEENKQNFCKALIGNTLFSALYGMYTVVLQELKALLKVCTPAGPTKTSPRRMQSQKSGGGSGAAPTRLRRHKKKLWLPSICRRRHAPRSPPATSSPP